MKTKTWQRIFTVLVVVIIAAAAIVAASVEPPQNDWERYEELLERIYGEGCAVKLPGQQRYGTLAVDDSGTDHEEFLFGKQKAIFRPIFFDRGDFREPYSGSEFSLTASAEKFKEGETITFTFANNSTDPERPVIEHGWDFCLEMLVEDTWQPVGHIHLNSATLGRDGIEPGQSIELEIDKTSLARQWQYKYHEDIEKYGVYKDLEKEVTLVPGRYRFSKSFEVHDEGKWSWHKGLGAFYIECEFDVVK